MMRIAFLLIISFSSTWIYAQSYNISGTVRIQSTGEAVIGATIEELGNGRSTITNAYGFYAISAPAGEVTLLVSYSGMKTDTLSFDLNQNMQKDFLLVELPQALEEVVIRLSPAGGRTLGSTQMGVERLSAKEMKFIPQLLGEKDPLKAIQLLPGIKSAGEGSSGVFVRGGSADQNLILLDEAVVYNASHLLGFSLLSTRM